MILFRYILRNHIGPFLFALVTLIFILLFNFLTKFADRLVGKGLGFWIITKLVVYNLAWMVVLVVPMSVLVATLMAYGNMANNNEIAIMKASGISIYKMILPSLLISIVLGLLLIEFNKDVYPDANHHARLLMQDISNKKPTLSLVPGVFSQEVSNYAILVKKIKENSNELEDITIYDYNNPAQMNVITAEKGRIYFSNDQKKLIMDLNNGEIHESSINDPQVYRKLVFTKHRILMDAEQFTFQQSTPGGERGDRELSAGSMVVIVDSLKLIRNNYISRLKKNVDEYLSPKNIRANMHSAITRSQEFTMLRVNERITTARNVIISDVESCKYNKEEINKYEVEIHKKYSLPAACIVFVLIGAPLGMMTRKGGIGVAAGISIVFFLIYWAFLIGGEKLSDRNLISPFMGMWSANIVLGILGVILTVKTARETITLDFSFFQKFIPKNWRATPEENENN
jgi:lipopolysaccharide export system permease protein